MPRLSMPLHPQVLQSLRPPAAASRPSGAAPQRSMGSPAPNPFGGTTAPGPFAQPAPFNPLMALMSAGLLPPGLGAPLGALRGVPARGFQPRGPMGAFGLAPELQQPRRQNPFARAGQRG